MRITGPTPTVKLARKLRSEMTPPEGVLWRALRQRPAGLKFRRQHPAGMYVIDFYCAQSKIAIEVEGSAHDTEDTMRRDAARSHFLRSQGITTLRVPATVVLSDVNAAVSRLVEVCAERRAKLGTPSRVPLHHPANGPPPRVGEE